MSDFGHLLSRGLKVFHLEKFYIFIFKELQKERDIKQIGGLMSKQTALVKSAIFYEYGLL